MVPSKKVQSWLPSIINDFLGNEWVAKMTSGSPAINIIENEKEYRVEVAAPGISKDDFTVNVDNDNLVISMEKKTQNEEKDEKYLRRDFSYSQFRQTMVLPENIDKENISARQEHGVLTVSIPKKEAPETPPAKKIEVK